MNSPSEKSTWERSTTRRFLRWLFSMRTLKRLCFVFVCFMTLIALFYAVENWRGKRAWEKLKAKLEAEGESFELSSLIPPEVPVGENFAMTPLLQPLFDYKRTPEKIDWRDPKAKDRLEEINVSCGSGTSLGDWRTGERINLSVWQDCFRSSDKFSLPNERGTAAEDILTALGKFEREMKVIETASRRPYSRFPIHYEEGIDTLLPHLLPLRHFGRLFDLRAVAYLEQGNTDAAFQDALTGLRLMESLKSEPLLISQLVRIALENHALQVVWEGLLEHRWTEEQLDQFQQQFSSIDLLPSFPLSIRGERMVFFHIFVEGLLKKRPWERGEQWESVMSVRFPGLIAVPRGWWYQNLVFADRFYQRVLIESVDLERRLVHVSKLKETDDEFGKVKTTPYNTLSKGLLPAFVAVGRRFALGQVQLDEALVACALERYRLRNGVYPEMLDSLAPSFMGKVPHDVINGNPLHYRRTDNGAFLLYSVGWDERDDGGKVVLTKTKPPRLDYDQGDWVWQSFPNESVE